MESQESISFSMDTTSDSFGQPIQLIKDPSNYIGSEEPINAQDGVDMMKLPPDKLLVTRDATSSTSKSTIPDGHNSKQVTNSSVYGNKARTKKVIFSTVTIYHFNRSQGFTTIPTQGGSTLGMKRKHFLRRKLKVDLYEEVRRRSRREILLKIRLEKRKREERLRRELLALRQELKDSDSPSSASSNTTTSDEEDNGSSYSDCSDISDSELESDGYIFLQPIGVNLRRSLLRASGVGRIDPSEKRECNFIRNSRDRSGCTCIGHCVPEYCECTRLGVNCHVDRVSFPCGCLPSGCQNPMGRTEFDIAHVRDHFEETVFRARSSSNCSENDPSNSDSSYETALERGTQETNNLEIDYNSDVRNELNRQTHETNRSSTLKTF